MTRGMVSALVTTGTEDMGHNLRILGCLRGLPRGLAWKWMGMTQRGIDLRTDE